VRTEDYSLVMPTSQPGTYIRHSNGNISNIYNSGQITGSAYAVQLNFGGTVVNAAQGIIEGGANDTGISFRQQPGHIINSGLVTAGVGIDLANGGYLSNASSGVIVGDYPTGNQPFGTGVQLDSGGASFVNAGSITGGYNGIFARFNGTTGNVSIDNSGVITGGSVHSNYGYDAGIWIYGNTGVVTIQNSGTIASTQGDAGEAVTLTSAALDLIVDSGAKFIGSVTSDAAYTDIIELTSAASAGSINGIGSQFTGFDTIAIDLDASWTIGGDATGLLNGIKIDRFTSRDTIDLTGTVATSDSFNSSTGVLTLFNSSSIEIGTLDFDFTTLFPGTTFALTSDGDGGTDITTNAICYLRGTRIVTAKGEMPAEDICIGDLVVTRAGGLRPVRWIGRQSFNRRFVQNNRGKIPVHIRAGALGAGLPLRDLFVSPGHSMLLGETLILARNLVNGITITQDFPATGDTIDYFQFELAGHDCILAEGSWSESFADGPGLRAQFHNLAEYLALHPDYVEPPQVQLCAPRPESGPALAAALQPLLNLAATGLPPGPLEGWIDDASGETLAGWALDTQYPELPLTLEIWAGADMLGSVLACEHRPDLEAAGKGNGQCAFYFPLPADMPAATRASLRIQRASDAACIGMTQDCRARVSQAA
jgi:hypothetical protein